MQNEFPVFCPKRFCRCAVLFLSAATLASGFRIVAAAQVPGSAAALPVGSASLPDAPAAHLSSSGDVTIRNTPCNFLRDQAAIWTSPKDLRTHDLEWLAPLAVATGVALDTDHYVMTQVVSKNPSFNQDSINASNAMIYSIVATPALVYGFGHFQQNDHEREAGILSAEAMLDGVVVEQGLKLVFWRERPGVDSSRGRFFQSSAGVDSSFPSSHSLIAWSAASALAAEYPSHWTEFALYTAATGVGITRVLGQEHFPADVLVGGALGWLIGHNVVRRHHRGAREGQRTKIIIPEVR